MCMGQSRGPYPHLLWRAAGPRMFPKIRFSIQGCKIVTHTIVPGTTISVWPAQDIVPSRPVSRLSSVRLWNEPTPASYSWAVSRDGHRQSIRGSQVEGGAHYCNVILSVTGPHYAPPSPSDPVSPGSIHLTNPLSVPAVKKNRF